MGRLTLIYIFLSSLTYQPAVLQTGKPHLNHDSIGFRDREKMVYLMQELITEMRLLQRQITPIRLQHDDRLSYEVGLVVGRLRERYKRMMEVFKEMVGRAIGTYQLFGPSLETNKALHFIMAMETMRELEHEIDRLVDVIVSIPQQKLDDDFYYQVSKQAEAEGQALPAGLPAGHVQGGSADGGTGAAPDRAPGRPPYGRAREAGSSEKLSTEPVPVTFRNQDDLKRYNREEYEINNMNKGNMANWSLDHFYGLI